MINLSWVRGCLLIEWHKAWRSGRPSFGKHMTDDHLQRVKEQRLRDLGFRNARARRP